jgi:hypothetical protein
MDGAHTHGNGPVGLGELIAVGAGVALTATVLARVMTFPLIRLTVAGGLLLVGFIGYVVVACHRYRQATALEAAQHRWPVLPDDLPRAMNANPVPLRQAITELHAQLLAAHAGLPAADRSQHLHFHGLTPEQAAHLIAELQARQPPAGWQNGGSQ